MRLGLDALPLDLVPVILAHLRYRVADLACCCLTSRLFCQLAQPLLYERLWLRDQTRLQRVFRTLASNARLCELVKVVELRVFPFGLTAELLEALETSIVRTFVQAINLEELAWTRTGSLNDRLIPYLLTSSPRLVRVEITGDARTWSINALKTYIPPTVQHLSIILPERSVVNALVDIVTKIVNAGRLRSLNLLCQHSPLVKDSHLQALAPFLPDLETLSLAGCRAVTGRGVQAILASASQSLTHLALEGLDIQGKDLHSFIPYAAHWNSLSLTYPRSTSSSGSRSLPSLALSDFYRHFADLVEHATGLLELTHYAGAGSQPARVVDSDDDGFVDLDQLDSDDEEEQDAFGNTTTTSSVEELVRRFSGPPPVSVRYGHRQASQPPINLPLVSTPFLSRLVNARGNQLVQLRLHGIGLSLDQLQLVVQHCTVLRDLVVQIWEDDLSRLAALLCQLPRLETLHILASVSSDAALGEEEMRWIAQMCSDANQHRRHAQTPSGSGLHQIGFRNRVWIVDHTLSEVQLKRWDPSAGMFPEILLVVRS